MATRTTRPTVDRDAVADPILATPPWRAGASRSPQVMAEAIADPHKYDWAGPGFTGPGPEPNVGCQASYPPGKPEALADRATSFDGPATPFTGRRHAPSGPVRQIEAERRTPDDRQHQ
jgi:hypothetical protein